jgi:adenylate kinase
VDGKCDACGGELYQRADDREETVRERLKVFLSQTLPIVDYYEKQGKLLRVDGNGRIEDVSAVMLRLLRTEHA